MNKSFNFEQLPISLLTYILTTKSAPEVGSIPLVLQLERLGIVPVIFQGPIGGELPAKTYFSELMRTKNKYGYDLSPGELGCALGHLSILRRIAESQDPYAVILEDDVVLLDGFETLVSSADFFTPNGVRFLHLGGLEGVEPDRLFARKIDFQLQLFLIDPYSLGYLHRTCGYIVTRPAACLLVQALERAIFRIDDFQILGEILGPILLTEVVSHPIDLGKSKIEGERIALKALPKPQPKSLLRRIADDIRLTISFRARQLRSKRFRRKHGFVQFDKLRNPVRS